MEIVRLLIQNLIVIIVLAVFLEMLLPEGDMKRYLNIVMGLLVIIAVLTALGNLTYKPWALELPEQLTEKSSTRITGLDEIMTSAKKISETQQNSAFEEYRSSLARQINALASLGGDLVILSTEIELYKEKDNPKFGQLKHVKLIIGNTTSSGQKDNKANSPIEIMINGKDKKNYPKETSQNQNNGIQTLPLDQMTRLKTIIANLYGLSPEQVEILEQSQ